MVVEEILARFEGKTVLITGHTGFKGSWMTYLLVKHKVKVVGLSLNPNTNPSLFNDLNLGSFCTSFIGDINDLNLVNKVVSESQPDFIFHMAAQPLVRYSYKNPIETFSTNVMGTANILEACKLLRKKCCVVCITTDKVYQNREWIHPYRENDELGGYDPYSASKAAAELVIDSYRKSFFQDSNIFIASARAGNVIGGGDWSEDRLIPDIIRSIVSDQPVSLRNPKAIRPWQHVLDPIIGYLLLAAKMDESGEAFCESWNFGPSPEDALSVEAVANRLTAVLKKGTIRLADIENKLHEANILRLDTTKAKISLGWSSRFNSQEAIEITANWYKGYIEKRSKAIDLMQYDIDLAKKQYG